MKKKTGAKHRRSLLIALVILGLGASVAFVPTIFLTSAAKAQVKSAAGPDLLNYDIRTDKNAGETLLSFRQAAGKNAVTIADVKDRFVEGENQLRQSVPTLKIEYNAELRNPGLIAPDVLQGRAFLTVPSKIKRVKIFRDFLKQNNSLLGLSSSQIDGLKTTADYANPNGELSFVSFEQFVGDVPVFRSEIRAAFNKENAMFRVINNSATEIDESSVSKNFGNPADAVVQAAGYLNYTLKNTDFNTAASTDLKAVFGKGDSATTAEKMYFPTEVGVARPAWRVLVWETGTAYYVIVDAETGTLLYRENITYEQTQTATYNVYANTTNLLQTSPNPAPLAAPGLLDPTLGTQGTIIPRTSVTLIGNEAPNTFNNLGWITDGNNQTLGNNVSAGVDRDTTNGADSFVTGTSRVFNFAYTPAAGPNNTGGDDPLLPAYQNGVVTNLFYVTNRYHDAIYPLGFTEAAKNFQADNFGRGGVANDRVLAEAQDNTAGTSSCPTAPCYNNANFSTPADGGSGRMQMYLWSAPTPDRDGDLDAEIIVHELTHGTFGRLHSGGISNTQAGQMNEGNSDFFAHVLLSNTADPINTVSTTGSYATLLLRGAAFTSNYYYGIRRFPKAVLAFTGGPNNRPHNPLTYKDIDPAQMSLTDGAYAPAFTGSATAVHDGGEIWSSMLWEVRARLVQRLGAVAGNKKILQMVMDGMKVSPSSPSMMQERNAIIAAAQANGNSADIGDVWAGFALRGMGFGATNTTGNTVVEAYNLPNAKLAEIGFFAYEANPSDGDGFPEPGEAVEMNIPIVNNSGNTINNVVGSIVGGGSANYGTIANGQTVSRPISFVIPAGAACGSLQTVNVNVSSDLGTNAAESRSFRLGVPAFAGTTQNFDGVTAPALPANWSQVNSGANTGWVTSTTLTGSAPNAAFAPSPATPGEASLSTTINVTSASAQAAFKIFYNTESTWDGTVLEIQIGNGAFQDILTAGGSFTSGGYNVTMDVDSPFGVRTAWSGSSTTFVNSVVNLPAAANGQTVVLRWRTVSDSSVTAAGVPGTRIDDVALTGATFLSGYQCSVGPTAAQVSVEGRVLATNGKGLTNARVTVTDSRGQAHSTMTTAFGNFHIDDLQAGDTVIISVTSKRLRFAPQVVALTDNVTGLIFMAQSGDMTDQ